MKGPQHNSLQGVGKNNVLVHVHSYPTCAWASTWFVRCYVIQLHFQLIASGRKTEWLAIWEVKDVSEPSC